MRRHGEPNYDYQTINRQLYRFTHLAHGDIEAP